MQQMILYCKLYFCSTCFWNHYAHHQELKSIIQVVAACGTWCFGLQVVGLVWSCRFAGFCSIPQTGHVTYSSTLDQKPVNQSTKYHRQQSPV